MWSCAHAKKVPSQVIASSDDSRMQHMEAVSLQKCEDFWRSWMRKVMSTARWEACSFARPESERVILANIPQFGICHALCDVMQLYVTRHDHSWDSKSLRLPRILSSHGRTSDFLHSFGECLFISSTPPCLMPPCMATLSRSFGSSWVQKWQPLSIHSFLLLHAITETKEKHHLGNNLWQFLLCFLPVLQHCSVAC